MATNVVEGKSKGKSVQERDQGNSQRLGRIRMKEALVQNEGCGDERELSIHW
tara:strand:- start:32 stop:187 length:156 start_codon:yes stop_codon:yes gene_type:complete